MSDDYRVLELLNLIKWMLLDLSRSRRSLEAEVVVLRQQLNVLRRSAPKRPALKMSDRLIFVWLYWLAPSVIDAMTIVRPETIVRWHRAGFRIFWRWKSRSRAGRPKVPLEVRRLIREISLANPLWGAPRIHGELLKLGIDIGQTSVAKYMARRRRPPSQGWRTFLLNHADGIASIDLFVVPTISFRLLYGLLVLGHGRRKIFWFGVTAHPTIITSGSDLRQEHHPLETLQPSSQNEKITGATKTARGNRNYFGKSSFHLFVVPSPFGPDPVNVYSPTAVAIRASLRLCGPTGLRGSGRTTRCVRGRNPEPACVVGTCSMKDEEFAASKLFGRISFSNRSPSACRLPLKRDTEMRMS